MKRLQDSEIPSHSCRPAQLAEFTHPVRHLPLADTEQSRQIPMVVEPQARLAHDELFRKQELASDLLGSGVWCHAARIRVLLARKHKQDMAEHVSKRLAPLALRMDPVHDHHRKTVLIDRGSHEKRWETDGTNRDSECLDEGIDRNRRLDDVKSFERVGRDRSVVCFSSKGHAGRPNSFVADIVSCIGRVKRLL